MTAAGDLEAQAREIVAANRYMVLSTADADGAPWVSPVWFATADGQEFLWISKPATRHSGNIGARPEIALVIFGSAGAPGDVAGGVRGRGGRERSSGAPHPPKRCPPRSAASTPRPGRPPRPRASRPSRSCSP